MYDSKEYALGGGFITRTSTRHVIYFKAISQRLSPLSKLSLINVHASTEGKYPEHKENFNYKLKKVYDDCPKNETKKLQ